MLHPSAEQIRDAFGPCSTVYECMTIKEIEEEILEEGSILRWVKLQIDCEDIRADRSSGLREDDKPYKEWLKMRAEILERFIKINISFREGTFGDE